METQQIKIPTRPKRKFVPENLIIDSWKKIESLFDNLGIASNKERLKKNFLVSNPNVI